MQGSPGDVNTPAQRLPKKKGHEPCEARETPSPLGGGEECHAQDCRGDNHRNPNGPRRWVSFGEYPPQESEENRAWHFATEQIPFSNGD
jgi:hypothetical protein